MSYRPRYDTITQWRYDTMRCDAIQHSHASVAGRAFRAEISLLSPLSPPKPNWHSSPHLPLASSVYVRMYVYVPLTPADSSFPLRFKNGVPLQLPKRNLCPTQNRKFSPLPTPSSLASSFPELFLRYGIVFQPSRKERKKRTKAKKTQNANHANKARGEGRERERGWGDGLLLVRGPFLSSCFLFFPFLFSLSLHLAPDATMR